MTNQYYDDTKHYQEQAQLLSDRIQWLFHIHFYQNKCYQDNCKHRQNQA